MASRRQTTWLGFKDGFKTKAGQNDGGARQTTTRQGTTAGSEP